MTRKLMTLTLALGLSGCGPKYEIPERPTLWSNTASYEFHVVQKGQMTPRGVIDSRSILDIEFTADCQANGNRHQCSITGPIRFFKRDANGQRSLQDQQSMTVTVQLDWRGRMLSAIDAPNVSDLFLGVMRNAFGALEAPGVPERCQIDYEWKTSDKLQIFTINELLGPGSFRIKHKTSDCDNKLHFQSMGALTLSGQASDNMPAERYSFEVVGATWVDLETGMVVEKNHRMTLASASVQAQRGDLIRQVTMKRLR